MQVRKWKDFAVLGEGSVAIYQILLCRITTGDISPVYTRVLNRFRNRFNLNLFTLPRV